MLHKATKDDDRRDDEYETGAVVDDFDIACDSE